MSYCNNSRKAGGLPGVSFSFAVVLLLVLQLLSLRIDECQSASVKNIASGVVNQPFDSKSPVAPYDVMAIVLSCEEGANPKLNLVRISSSGSGAPVLGPDIELPPTQIGCRYDNEYPRSFPITFYQPEELLFVDLSSTSFSGGPCFVVIAVSNFTLVHSVCFPLNFTFTGFSGTIQYIPDTNSLIGINFVAGNQGSDVSSHLVSVSLTEGMIEFLPPIDLDMIMSLANFLDLSEGTFYFEMSIQPPSTPNYPQCLYPNSCIAEVSLKTGQITGVTSSSSFQVLGFGPSSSSSSVPVVFGQVVGSNPLCSEFGVGSIDLASSQMTADNCYQVQTSGYFLDALSVSPVVGSWGYAVMAGYSQSTGAGGMFIVNTQTGVVEVSNNDYLTQLNDQFEYGTFCQIGMFWVPNNSSSNND